MNKYSSPKTTCLEVMANDIICASQAPAPGRSGSIGTMGKTTGVW